MADGAIGEGDGVEGQPSGAVSLGQQSPKSLLPAPSSGNPPPFHAGAPPPLLGGPQATPPGMVQGPGTGPPLFPPLGGPGPDTRPPMMPPLAPPGSIPHIRSPAGMMGGLIPPNFPPGATLGVPPGGVGTPPNVMGMGQKEIWLEHKMPNGRSYYSNLVTRQTKWEKPVDAIIQPGPPALVGGASGNQGGTPPSQPLLPHPPMPIATPSGPPLVPARVWSEHTTEDGKIYFYNKITMASVWERPTDFDLILPLPVSLAGNQALKSKEEPPKKADEDDSTAKKAGEGEPETEQESKGETQEGKAEVPMDTQPTATASEPDVSQNTPKAAVTMDVDKVEPSGPRPIATQPVSGTPWSVVWTSDQRYFFFNATSRESTWSIPEDIQHLQILKVLLAAPPGKRRLDGPGLKAEEDREGLLAKKPRIEEEEEEDTSMTAQSEVSLEGVRVVEAGEQGAPGNKAGEGVAKAGEGEVARRRASLPLEARQSEFKEMLLERGVSAFSTWDKELPKFCFDKRYLLLSTKERRAAFEDFIRERADEERREKKSKLKEVKEGFRMLLAEAKLTPKSTFMEFSSSKFSRDERYKAVERMKEREALFVEYIQEMKKNKKEAEKAARTQEEKIKEDFFTMLSEDSSLSSGMAWKSVKSSFRKDPRYKVVEGSSQRGELFKQYLEQLETQKEADADRSDRRDKGDRSDRAQASLREREREVQMSRTRQEKEWDKEKDSLRKAEALQFFNAMLVDMVRKPDVSWHEAKKTLKRDVRWEVVAASVDSTEREAMFQSHIRAMNEKKRVAFRKLLDETLQITLTLSWKKARKLIKSDPRYEKFGENDQEREKEYDQYLLEKMISAKKDFKQLLKEVRMITHTSQKMMKDSDRHLKDIVEVLKNDRRFLVLDCVADDREEILLEYIAELAERGPPPPPTATARSERPTRR